MKYRQAKKILSSYSNISFGQWENNPYKEQHTKSQWLKVCRTIEQRYIKQIDREGE